MIRKLILEKVKNQLPKTLTTNIQNIMRFILLLLCLTFHTTGKDIIRVALTVYVVQFIFGICQSFIKTNFRVPFTFINSGNRGFEEDQEEYLARKRGKENVFVYVSWRRYYFSPTIPCTLVTRVFFPCSLKVTIQKFRDFKVLQTPVKIAFHLSIVISTCTRALRFIHETRAVGIFFFLIYFI